MNASIDIGEAIAVERYSPPVASWLVIINDDEPLRVAAYGETPLGMVEDWRVVATLLRAGEGVDRFTVAISKGEIEARAQSHYAEGAPPGEAATLQVSGVGKRPIVTCAFRAVT